MQLLGIWEMMIIDGICMTQWKVQIGLAIKMLYIIWLKKHHELLLKYVC